MQAQQVVSAQEVVQRFGRKHALSTIYNHDRIAVLRPVPTRLVTAPEFVRNQALADGLKAFYACRCQIYGQDFEARFGKPYAETHHIQYLRAGGPDISTNIVVICPNHHRIIHATNAQFNRDRLTYEYPNGLREPLLQTDHFDQTPAFDRLDPKAG
jgi:predicted restriction endonuclease